MPTRKDLRDWLIETLKIKKGSASIPEVCKYICMHENHENELRRSGNLFFTWQYDIRWAAKQLRDERIMRPHELSPRGIWELE